jgi:hypothetical protein
LGAGVLIFVCAVAVAAFNSLQDISPRTLSPARVPPVVGVCTQQLNLDQNGNVSPLFCPDGGINTLAWSYYARQQLSIMAMGQHPKPSAVEMAIEQDLKARASATAECNAATLAAAYYGWNFHIKPVSGLRLDCPIQGQF